MKSFALLSALAFASSALAHMQLGPLLPPYPGGDTSPLNNGQAFCKGLQNNANAKPTPLQPGANKFNLAGSAVHGGGSMQASLSFDGGKTFKVVKSFVGGFPKDNSNPPEYTFTIPSNAKAGAAIFSWSWSNRIGNREFYQDCAPITIGGSGTSTLNDLPDMFVSNLAAVNTCKNEEMTAVAYPNPGKDVEMGPDPTKPPTGDCGSKAAAGAPANPASPPAEPPANPAAPAPSAPDNSTPETDPAYGGGSGDTDDCDDDMPATTPPVGTPPAEDDCDEGSTTPPANAEGDDCEDDGTPEAGSPAPSTDGTSYTVKSGDTCYLIGEAQGVDYKKIMSMNPAINSECTNLEPGQVITLRKRSRVMRF